MLLAVMAAVTSLAQTSAPEILSIRLDRGDAVVVVQAPPGVRKLMLESRTRFGAGTWIPRAVKRLDGTGGSEIFRLPQSEQIELLRVRGDAEEPLPDSFYRGQTNFNAAPSSSSIYGGFWDSEIGVPTADNTGAGAGGGERTVVESDIWAVRDQVLYFFNQYRGLQVVDLHTPDQPALLGQLPMPAAGEQMYLLDSQHAVLLTRDDCSWGAAAGSEVLVVNVDGGTPRITARVPLSGTILESRLVGQALYVAAQTYRKVTPPPDPTGTSDTWEWGLELSGIDLRDPGTPVVRSTLWYSGYGQVVTATPEYFFLVSLDPSDYWHSVVRIVDVQAPDGTLVRLGSIKPAGQVQDKFKLHVMTDADRPDVLAVISEDNGDGVRPRTSVLETFSLEDPRVPKALGRLEVGHGEGLYATRFDGTRAYLVTFLRIDPLWIVDLRDPTQPALYGELEVPGWSTYIHPLGNRLVTVGIDNSNSWRVAVSLFNVMDPAKPTLLGKVALGENSSWSEANADEKAFAVLPDAGLILVPYEGWMENDVASRVQLIDLKADGLEKRGVIEHDLQPRRATDLGDRLVSISGRELLVANAADRDHPIVTADLELSWSADRVLLAGNHQLQISDGWSWLDRSTPMIHVASANTPQTAETVFSLEPAGPVLGAAVHGERLCVLQSLQSSTSTVTPANDPPEPEPPNLRCLLFDLSELPALRLLSSQDSTVKSVEAYANYAALWPDDDVLVWASGAGGNSTRWYGYWWDIGPMVGGWWWPWGYNDGGHLLTYRILDANRPDLASEIQVTTNTWRNFSPAWTANGRVFLSHQTCEYIPRSTGGKSGDPTTPGRWECRHFLNVVDYADPANPTVRKPTPLPGELSGIALGGELLFTAGCHYDTQGTSDGAEYVDALAYDGIQATLVSSLAIGSGWPRAFATQAQTIVVATEDPVTGTGRLARYQFATAGTQSGQFVLESTCALPTAYYFSLGWFGGLLGVQAGSEIRLLDTTVPAGLTTVGSGVIASCLSADWSQADGRLDLGLFLPMSNYGVLQIPVQHRR